MKRGWIMTDYSVTIGLGVCEVLDLQTKSLRCKVPKEEPKPRTDASHNGSLQVMVSRSTFESC